MKQTTGLSSLQLLNWFHQNPLPGIQVCESVVSGLKASDGFNIDSPASQGRQQLMPQSACIRCIVMSAVWAGSGLTLGTPHSIRLPAQLVVAPTERCESLLQDPPYPHP